MGNDKPASLKTSIETSFHLPQPELERCLERHGKRQTNLSKDVDWNLLSPTPARLERCLERHGKRLTNLPKDVDWNLLSLLLRRFLRAYLTWSPLLGGTYFQQDPASTWTSPATPRPPCSPASTGGCHYPPSLAD